MPKTDLVFEGGGAKGMVFVGALEVLLDDGQRVAGRLLGTSAGAITAVTLAAGYTSAEMLEALSERDVNGHSVFAAFLGEPAPFDQVAIQESTLRKLLASLNLPFVPDFIEDRVDDWIVQQLAANPDARHVFSFVERGGWFSADAFVAWLERRLNTGTFNGEPRRFGNLTLKQFHDATGSDVTVVTADTTWSRMLLLNHRTAPDCPVVWAARMSMSIPLLWQEVVWQKEWGTYHSWDPGTRQLQPTDVTGHILVDGGMLSNFPIAMFLSDREDVAAVMGSAQGDEVIGLLIDDSAPLPGRRPAAATTSAVWGALGSLETVQRLERLISTATSANDNMAIAVFAKHIVRLPAGGYGTTQFDMTDTERAVLVDAGRQPMRDFLKTRLVPEALSFALSSDRDEAVELANQAAGVILRP
jgi:NTE family protein